MSAHPFTMETGHRSSSAAIDAASDAARRIVLRGGLGAPLAMLSGGMATGCARMAPGGGSAAGGARPAGPNGGVRRGVGLIGT